MFVFNFQIENIKEESNSIFVFSSCKFVLGKIVLATAQNRCQVNLTQLSPQVHYLNPKVGMAIFLCPSPFAPHKFSSPHKGGGAGMGQDFSSAPRGGPRMGLDFLNPPRPALLRVIIVNFLYPKILLFKKTYQY